MAQFNLRPPEAFDFKNPDDWPRWKRRFEQLRVASGLTDDSEECQVSTLLYCLGEEADAVLTSTNPSADDKKKYGSVIENSMDSSKYEKRYLRARTFQQKKPTRRGEC